MSSLWTPGGEHRVPRGGEEAPAGAPSGTGPAVPEGGGRLGAAAQGPGSGAAAFAGEPVGPQAVLAAEQLAALERELVGVPAADVVANHCYGLFELAAVHLGQDPPHLSEAQVAIDALGAVVERLGDRLGEATTTLVEAVAQIRLAYVQIASASPPGDEHDRRARRPRPGEGCSVALAHRAVGELAEPSISAGDGLVEVAARGVTKASALAGLAAELGIDREEVVAFGDMLNDLSMLEWAGHGVAMGNAHDLVKASAGEITASCEEDGVAVVLERVLPPLAGPLSR